MVVVKVAEHDVFDKVDTQFVEDRLSYIEHVGMVFICTADGGEDDDWMDEYGVRYFIIRLPYEEVLHATDIRPMMLAKAKERLGLVA